MRTLVSLSLVMMSVLFSTSVVAEDTLYKPFILASAQPGTLKDQTLSTLNALQQAGFVLTGQYSPVEGTNVLVVTSDELREIAAISEKGGYGAGQRVSISEAGDNIEVAFVNPLYIQYAYRMEGDMQPVYDALTASLGEVEACGGGKKKMTAKKLGKYHYMVTMQYFDDPSELGSFESYEAAVAAVEKGLAVPGDALSQVYRIVIHLLRQSFLNVRMKMTNEEEKDIDSAFQMSVVDFEGCKKRAYFPYEVLVNGKDVEALHMRFRMAVHFPNLSMAGKHGFTKLISAPGAIEDALEALVKPEE